MNRGQQPNLFGPRPSECSPRLDAGALFGCAAHVKAIICTVISALPVRWWPRASAIARRAWRGFGNA